MIVVQCNKNICSLLGILSKLDAREATRLLCTTHLRLNRLHEACVPLSRNVSRTIAQRFVEFEELSEVGFLVFLFH